MVKSIFLIFYFDLSNFDVGLNELGIFRRAASVSLIKQIQNKYNEGFNKKISILNTITMNK